MGSTTIVLRSFEEPRFKVTEFENTLVRVTPFLDAVVVVPGNIPGNALLNEDAVTPILNEDDTPILVE